MSCKICENLLLRTSEIVKSNDRELRQKYSAHLLRSQIENECCNETITQCITALAIVAALAPAQPDAAECDNATTGNPRMMSFVESFEKVSNTVTKVQKDMDNHIVKTREIEKQIEELQKTLVQRRIVEGEKKEKLYKVVCELNRLQGVINSLLD